MEDEPLVERDIASNRLSLLTKFSFGLGASPNASTAAVTGFFLSPFLAEIAKVPPSHIAQIVLAGRLWDAITDPIIGALVSRTPTRRWGKAKPWMAVALPFAAVAYVCVWLVLAPLDSRSSRLAYYLLAYCLYQTAITCYYVPYTTLTMDLTDDLQQRDVATSWRMSVEVIVVLICVVLQGQLIAMAPALGGDAAAYRTAGVVVAAAFVVAPGAACVAGVTRRASVATDRAAAVPEVPGLRGVVAGFRLTLKSKAYVCLTNLYLCSWVSVMMVQSSVLFYLNHALGRGGVFQLVLAVLMTATFVSIPLWALVLHRIGKKSCYLIAIACHIVILLAFSMLPRGVPTWILCLLAAGAGPGLAVSYLVPWTMLPDVIDAAELEHGKRQEAFFYSFFVFFQKFATGIALFLSSFSLDLGGWITAPEDEDQGDVVQPESVALTLRFLVGPVPAALLLVSFVFLWLYPLSSEAVRLNKVLLSKSAGVSMEETRR